MSGHYYLRPNSLSDNNAVFPYRPSSALHLPSAFPADVNLSPPPPVSPTAAQRNVDLIKVLHNEQKSWEEDGELMRLLRNRTRGWTTSVGCSEGNDEANESGQAGQKCIELDNVLPRAFQFHKDPEQMRQFWSEGHQRDQSAITRPTPSAMLQTPRRPMDVEEPTKGDGMGVGSSTSKSMTAPSSSALASTSKVPPAVSIPDSLSTYLDSHFPPHPANDPILSISIYSLPLLRSNRLTRRRAAAEKRYDRYKRDRAESLTPTLASHHQQVDNDDVEKEDGRSQQVPTTAESRLFLPRFSLSTAHHQANAAAEDDDGEEDLTPTQSVEMYASQTLQDLRRAMVCRLDDLPQRRGREGSGAEARSLDVVDRARYTGRKRPPNCDLILVEGHLAGEHPTDQVYQAIKRRLVADRRTRAAVGSTLDAEDTSEIIECELQSTRLADLPAVRLHKPYWLLHQGVCEHFWVIDRVRLPTAEDPLPPSPRTSTSSGYSHPITTFLAHGALLRPIPHFARAKAVEGAYALGKCSICERNTAHFAVVGGEGIDQGGSNEGGLEEGDRRHRLPALPNQVQAMCQSCLSAFAGQPQPLRVGKDGRFATSSSSSQAASARKRRRMELRTQGSQSVARDGEATAESFLRNVAARNADVSDGEVWKLLSERLEREKGWTIVPLLD